MLIKEYVFIHLKYLPSQYLIMGKVRGTGWMHGYVCQVHPPFKLLRCHLEIHVCDSALVINSVSGGLVRAGIDLC